MVDGQGAAHSLRPRCPPRATSPTRSAGTPPRSRRTRHRAERTSGLCQPPVHAIAVRRIWQTSRGKDEERVARARTFLEAATTGGCSPGTATWQRPVTPRVRGSSPSTIPGRAARTTPRAGTLSWRGSPSGRSLLIRATTSSTSPTPRTARPTASTTASVAAGAPQAGPLRRGRHLREAPLPRQRRTLLRHPGCGQRGVVGDLRGRRRAARRTGSL